MVSGLDSLGGGVRDMAGGKEEGLAATGELSAAEGAREVGVVFGGYHRS